MKVAARVSEPSQQQSGVKRPRIENLERGIKVVSVDTGISHPNLLPAELEGEALTEHHALVLKKEHLQLAGCESSARCVIFAKSTWICGYIMSYP